MRKFALVVKTLLIVLVVGVGVGGAYIYSGTFEVAADVDHHPAVHWVLRTARRHSIAQRERSVEVHTPESLAGEALLDAVIAYEDMCASCHAPPGRDRTALARGLNPPPSNLVRGGTRYSAAKLFWVTKHGIKMSGMPAWGVTHSDEELWTLVALIQRFPNMDGAEYERLLAEALDAGMEHVHGDAEDHDHDH